MPQLGAAGPDRPRQQSLPCWRSFQASIHSSEEQDRSRHHSAHRGGLESWSTGTGLYGAVSVDPVLSCCVV